MNDSTYFDSICFVVHLRLSQKNLRRDGAREVLLGGLSKRRTDIERDF
jgi:hypothetical protein